MMLGGKTVLVTGATGFIGGRLVEKLVLEQHAHVRMIVRSFVKAVRASRLPVEMIAGNINDATLVQKAAAGCEAVFHCAYDFAASRDEQNRTGVEGTRNVCEAVLRENVPSLVHVSSFAVYSPMSNGVLTEASPRGKIRNSYVSVKREAERLVMSLHRERGLPVVVIQPTLVYGPRSQHWTLGPVHQLKTGLVPLVADGSGYCNAVYIDDVVDSLILAATRPNVLGETFLVSAAEPVTWKSFYGALEAALGVESIVPMSEKRLREDLKKSRQQPGLAARLLEVARHPEVYPQLVAMPGVRNVLRGLRSGLQKKQWEKLKSTALKTEDSPARKQDSVRSKPLYLPDDSLLALYLTKTHVSIEKAQQRLEYRPKFDLEQGMDLTTGFIRWANLA